MKKIILFLVLILTFTSIILSQNLCQSKSSYTIFAKLIPVKKIINGKETIVWKNYSQKPIKNLFFHLYLNAFKNELSTFMTESGGRMGGHIKLKDNGYINLKEISITDESGQIINFKKEFVSPDDGNKNDRTVMKLELKQDIKPDEKIKINIDFISKLPPIIARNGYSGNCFIVAQWFPKLGVLEVPPMRGVKEVKWNCHEYHRNGEFYANFSNYNVTIEVPKNYIVGASGQKIDEKINGNLKKLTFSGKCIHDFAWAANPDFYKGEFIFNPNKEISEKEYEFWSKFLGVPVEKLRLKPVKITILMDSSHRDFMDLSLRTLKSAIKYYGILFGPYPYKTITMVDPPPGAFGASGMEYPTFFTAGTSILLKYPPLKYTHFETVIIHEFGHNYWQGMVANNEGEEAWIDEGINSFCESTVLSIVLGKFKQPFSFLTFSSFLHHRFNFLNSLPLLSKVDTFSWKFPPGEYETNSYDKPVMFLLTLKNIVGEKNFFRFLRGAFEKFKFTHPSTEDFLNFANEYFSFDKNLQNEVKNFLYQSLYTTKSLDFLVKSIENSKLKNNWFSSKVILEKRGDFQIPVNVKFIMKDGNTKILKWNNVKKYKTFYFKNGEKVREVIIDPDLKIAIDRNFTNNFYSINPTKKGLNNWKNFWGVFTDFIFSLFAELN